MLPIQRYFVESGAYFCSCKGAGATTPPFTPSSAHCGPVLLSAPPARTVCVTHRDSREPTLRYCALCIIWSFKDRKSTRLNSSHANISYAVFCLKKKKEYNSY